MFKNIKQHRRGIIGTTLFHTLLIIFFLLYQGFSTTLPLPDEEGIEVNFGFENSGEGEIEPPKTEIPPPVKETVQPEETVEEIIPEEKEQMLTQDIEEAPEVDAAEEKKKQEEKQKKEEKEKKKLEEERKKELERLAKIERERENRKQDSIAQVIREEKAKENAERIEKMFGGGDKNNQSTGDGNKQGSRNQGEIEGNPNANNYDGTSKGDGISFSLAGRNFLTLPEPEYNKQESGYIVVEVIVDREGNVVDAIPGKKGTTVTDNKLMEAAKKAALNAKFDTKPNAPPRQSGTITYHFVLE